MYISVHVHFKAFSQQFSLLSVLTTFSTFLYLQFLNCQTLTCVLFSCALYYSCTLCMNIIFIKIFFLRFFGILFFIPNTSGEEYLHLGWMRYQRNQLKIILLALRNIATIIPVCKFGPGNLFSNIKPISLLSTLSKMTEKSLKQGSILQTT